MLIHNRLGVPAFSCEMLNSFHCFVDIVCLVVNFFVFVSEVLVHYNRNLDAAFVKYIKICNVTKPFLCIWNSTQHLHEKKKKRWLLFWLFCAQGYPSNRRKHLFHSFLFLTLTYLLNPLCPLFPFSFRNPFTIIHRLTARQKKKSAGLKTWGKKVVWL